jgi:hypothetical protein
MRKIVSYAASLAFIFGAFFFLLTTPTLARDPGVAGSPDDDDASAIQSYCELKYPSDVGKFNQCFAMLQITISQGWDAVSETVERCSELPSALQATCEVAAPGGTSFRNDILDNIQQDLPIFLNKSTPYYDPATSAAATAGAAAARAARAAFVSGPNDNDDKDVNINGGEIGFVGSPNCGLPREGIDGNTDVTKCCYTPPNTRRALQERTVNLIPRTLCPPDWVGAPLDSISDGLFEIGATIITPFAPGVKIINNIFGRKGDGNEYYDEDQDADFCFTDLIRVGVGNAMAIPAFFRVDQMNLPQQACIQSALPVMGGNRLALESEYGDKSCKCMYPEDVQGGLLADEITQSFCSKYIDEDEFPREHEGCVSCRGIWTSIGCVETDMGGFISSMLRIGLGISFGAAFIVMLYSAYLLQTSQGNPEKVRKAREYLNSAIIGILVVIFAAFILQLVGIQILRIPGLDILPPTPGN